MSERYARLFGILVVWLAALEFSSWMSFQYPVAMPVVASVILLTLVAIGIKWPWVPALASLAELTIGGKGYLWFWTIGEFRVSFRLALFVVLVGLAFWQVMKNRRWPKIPVLIPASIYLGWVMVMALVGGIHGYGWTNVFLDANGFLFLGSLLTWTVLFPTRSDWKDLALTVLLAGVTWLGIKSGILVYLFSHQPGNIQEIYRWVRNSGVGEVTLIREPAYRVFFQSHVYSLFVWLVTLAGFVWGKAARWWMWPMIASAFGIYLSLSRSFWLGLVAGLIILLVLSIRQLGIGQLKRWLIILPVAASVWLLTTWAYQWPYIFPAPGFGAPNLVVSRLTATEARAASNARINQLEPLQAAIVKSPIMGYGFGKTLRYYSTDPRVRGWRTTAAFELGYHDLVLKYGLIGLGILVWLLWQSLKIIRASRQGYLWIGGLTALMVLHATTPYLNHPLGLGWLTLATIYAAHDT